MAKKIHSVLFHTLLLAVYAVFFSVQCFCNSGGQSNTANILNCSSVSHYTGNTGGIVKNGPLRSSLPSSHSIRLNKHFHQSDISTCTVFSAEAPGVHFIPG